MEARAAKHGMTSAAKHEPHDHHDHHAHLATDFRKRFWISLALTLPMLLLSPLLQELVGLREAIRCLAPSTSCLALPWRSFGAGMAVAQTY